MTSTRNPLDNFFLTPQQQSLLFAALNSNQPVNSQAVQPLDSLTESPLHSFDYDIGPGDSSYDFSFDDGNQSRLDDDSLDKSESPEADSPDKRSHPDDDDDDEEEGGAKRREGDDRVAKKPGRKPLTTEPTTKRKAQNRAAQRAFRERKEKHLRDLENKVKDLEKASENANHENDLLRTKINRMTSELNEYKKRVSLLPNVQPPLTATNNKTLFANHINDVNFQFEFPKFGGPLPGPIAIKSENAKRSMSASSTSGPTKSANRDQLNTITPPGEGVSPGNSSTYSQIALDPLAREDLANLSANLFSPPMSSSKLGTSTRGGSVDSHLSFNAASSGSPSNSSNSNTGGASSSCGTSPEPFTQSPLGFKPVDTLTTIGEEQLGLNSSTQDVSQFGNVNVGDFNWLPQSDFQFDPQLFGNYREPQENVLTKSGVDDAFFTEAFDIDFTTPYNMPVVNPPPAKKVNLIAQIDAANSSDDYGDLTTITCTKIWEKLQNCPKVQNGDFDLDGLCSELQKKAKCTGSGPVVDQEEFKTVMNKYLGKDDVTWDGQLVDKSKATATGIKE